MNLKQPGWWHDFLPVMLLSRVALVSLLLLPSSVVGQEQASAAGAAGAGSAGEGVETVAVVVEVAHLMYGTKAQTSICFSTGYLDLLRRETNIVTAADPVYVAADSTELFKYPFAVLTGEGDFTLNEKEIAQLQHYLKAGGFILASAGCSNAAWDSAFRREFKRLFAERTLEQVPLAHEIFHTVFEIDQLQTRRQSATVELFGLQIDGRVALVYSPQGLNDTGNAGGGCCCCGGNEIRNAKYLNANFLAYALTK